MQKITLAKSFKTKGLSKVVVCSLTAGFDTFTGGAGNDTFTSTTDGHYSIDDTLVGGAGTDTLFLRAEDATDGAVSTTGIEIVDIRTVAGGSTLDVTNMAGLTTVIHSSGIGALTINGAAAGVGVEIKNQSDTDATTLNFKSGSLVGTADTVNVALNGNTGAHTLTINDATGEIDTLAISGSVANTAVTTLAGDALDATSVVFTNTAAVVTAGAITSGTIDASAATGAVTVVVGTADLTFTGGSGSDSLDMAGTLTTADTIVGGAGSDTIVLDLAPTAATGARVTGFEVVRVGATALTFDNDFLSVVAYELEDGLAATTLSDLANNTTLTLLGDHAGIVTANIKTNTANDVFNLVFANTAAATQTVAEIDGDSVIDTLNITSGGGGANTITAFDIDVQNVIVTGSQALTITAFTNNSGSTEELEIFNASASTGAITATFTNADNALTVTGSATAANTIVLSAGNDTYTGGAGVDTVTGAAGDDTITLGGGIDAIVLVAVAAAGEAKDIVTDFVAGTDNFDINFTLVDDDQNDSAAGDAANHYVDVAAGATTTTITGNGTTVIFEFSNAADVLGEGVAGTFNAVTATGAELLAAVIEQLATDVAVALTDAGPSATHLLFAMYDESGNAVLVNFTEEDATAPTSIDAADHLEFVVLEGVSQGALTAADFV